MASLFGKLFNRKPKPSETITSPIPPDENDGSLELGKTGIGGYNYSEGFDITFKTEVDLINLYRKLGVAADVESAIDEIVNEAIVFDEGATQDPIALNLDGSKLSKNIKNKISEEFENVLDLLDFANKGDEKFRQWYIDGRMYHHIMIDSNSPKEGIKEIRMVDSRHIKKVKETEEVKDQKTGLMVTKVTDEFFIYDPKYTWDDKKFGKNRSGTYQIVRMAPESVSYVHSGLYDGLYGIIISYLHSAVRPYNQLKAVEDSAVIYRLSRAPQRRIFYVDIGNLPKTAAEEYLSTIISKYRNKIVYDTNTGAVKDEVAHRSMLEDIWLPRREGSRGTEVDTLAGDGSLGDLEELDYFRKKLGKALHIPLSRLEQGSTFAIGKATEITRDEIKFSRFISKLRKKFAKLFFDLLKVQLILKGIITEDEWPEIQKDLKFIWNQDLHFSELKETETLAMRIELLDNMDQYVGKYFSTKYIRKNILRQSDEEIAQIDSEIKDDESKGFVDTGDEDGNDSGDGEDSQDDSSFPEINNIQERYRR